MKNITKRKGALTAEAALILPIFICMLVGAFMLLKLFYIGSVIQSGLNKTLDEICFYSYVKTIVDDEIPNGLNSIPINQDALPGNIKELIQTIKKPEKLIEKTIVINRIKNNIFNEKDRMQLENLGVDRASTNLDLNESEILKDGKSVLLTIKYKVKIVIPPFFEFTLPIEQRAYKRTWVFGDGSSLVKEVENLWAMKPIERGKKIQKLLGRNMETSNFKTITSYNKFSGEATSIKSIDLSAKSYQSSSTLYKTIDKMLAELIDFKGKVKIMGDSKSFDVYRKRLLIVVPGDCRNDQNQSVFNELTEKALLNGIKLDVLNYGNKN